VPSSRWASTWLASTPSTPSSVNSYSASKHYESLKGRRPRVSFPSDSSTGYTLFSTGATSPGR
jgi:hypothetical protein